MRFTLRTGWAWGVAMFLVLLSWHACGFAFATSSVSSPPQQHNHDAAFQVAAQVDVVGTLPEVPVVSQNQAPAVVARKVFLRFFSFFFLPALPTEASSTFCRALLLRPVATPLLDLNFTHAP